MTRPRSPKPLTPLPLGDLGERKVTIAAIGRLRFRGLSVAVRLAGLLARLFGAALAGRLTARSAGRMTREALASLGGLWVKFGEILSAAQGAWPPGFLVELMQLHHQNRGFDPALARAAIEEDLGPIGRLFLSYEDLPFAAGSIGQAHRAVLRETGEAVVVKVRRPDIELTYRRDLVILGGLLRLLNRFDRFHHLRLSEMHRELARAIDEELDYRREADSLRRLRKLLKPHRIEVPRTWPGLSSERVIVMEHVEGVFLSDFLSLNESDPIEAEIWLSQNRIDPKRVADRLYRSLLGQIIEDGLYHADFGPGNLLFLPGGRIGVIDGGAVGRTHPDFQKTYARFLRSIADREYVDAVDRFLRFFEPIPPVDLDQAKKDMLRSLRSWDRATRIHALPYVSRSMTSAWAEIGRICSSHRIAINWYGFRMDRSFLALDQAMRYLHERMDHHRVLIRYFRTRRARQLRDIWKPTGAVLAPDPERLDLQIEDAGSDFSDIVNRNALVLEQTGKKFSAILGLAFDQARFLWRLAACYFVLVFVQQTFDSPIQIDPRLSMLGRALRPFDPPLDTLDWLLLALLLLVLRRALAVASLRLGKKESEYRALLQ